MKLSGILSVEDFVEFFFFLNQDKSSVSHISISGVLASQAYSTMPCSGTEDSYIIEGFLVHAGSLVQNVSNFETF